jgi:hypothetical protein
MKPVADYFVQTTIDPELYPEAYWCRHCRQRHPLRTVAGIVRHLRQRHGITEPVAPRSLRKVK